MTGSPGSWAAAAHVTGYVAWYALTFNAIIGSGARLGRRLISNKRKRRIHERLISYIGVLAIAAHITAALLAHRVHLSYGFAAGVGATVPILLIVMFHTRSKAAWWVRVHQAMLAVIALASAHALLAGPNDQALWSILPAIASLTVLANVLLARWYKGYERRVERPARRERPARPAHPAQSHTRQKGTVPSAH